MADDHATSSGLVPWLLGGLVVGAILLGLLVAAYEIGYHRGQHHGAAPPPTATPTTPTTPATTPTTTTPGSSGTLVNTGKQLYTAYGCASCHSLTGTPGVGPSFKGLAGSSVTLTTGTTVTANDSYLAASIRNPDAQIVKGYHAGVMGPAISAFNLTAKPQDITALVAFIKTQK